MTQSRGGVRRRRSTLVIGVTGGAGPLGAALTDRLAGHHSRPTVIGLDTARRPTPDMTWRLADVRDPALATRLEGVDTLVHLATDRSAGTPAAERRGVNVQGTEVVLAAAVSAGVRRVVLLTSAMVYGATAANPVPLAEDAAILPAGAAGLVGDWIEMERAATAQPSLETTVVRPASLLGPVTDTLLPGLFGAMRLLGIRDARCLWQFCHADDLIDALLAAAVGDVSGAVTVGCDGYLSTAEVEAISGMRSVVLPAMLAAATADRLHRIGALASPSSDLDYLTHPWVVGSQQLRGTGWSPSWTNEAALREHLLALGDRAGGSRIGREGHRAAGAAAGAGATLAVIGSLALARARRRR